LDAASQLRLTGAFAASLAFDKLRLAAPKFGGLGGRVSVRLIAGGRGGEGKRLPQNPAAELCESIDR